MISPRRSPTKKTRSRILFFLPPCLFFRFSFFSETPRLRAKKQICISGEGRNFGSSGTTILQASLPVVRQQPKMIFLWGVFFHGTRYSNWQQPKNVFGVENCTPRRENIADDLREASWKYSTILVSRFYVPSIGSTLKFRSLNIVQQHVVPQDSKREPSHSKSDPLPVDH